MEYILEPLVHLELVVLPMQTFASFIAKPWQLVWAFFTTKTLKAATDYWQILVKDILTLTLFMDLNFAQVYYIKFLFLLGGNTFGYLLFGYIDRVPYFH